MTLLLASTVDVTIVVLFALVAVMLLKHASAALRHAVLAAAVSMATAVPLLEWVVPQWELAILAASPATHVSSTLNLSSTPVPAAAEIGVLPGNQPLDWIAMIGVMWALGAAVALAGLAIGFLRLARASRRSVPITSGPWYQTASELATRAGLTRTVVLLQSADPSQLLTWGVLRPRILVPAGADSWTDERCAVVLAHEMAHIRRGDWLLQIVAEALRSIYWFNPLVWIACQRLRQESEYACDDAVLDRGVEPANYATHLLDVAREAIGRRGPWASAPAVAHPSTLERRIAAMLTHNRNRRPLTRRAGALATLGAILIAVPVATVTLTERIDRTPPTAALDRDVSLAAAEGYDVSAFSRTDAAPAPQPAAAPEASAPASGRVAADTPRVAAAQQPPAAIAAVVQDQSGAVLPGVEITLTDMAFGVRYTAVTDAIGAFGFRELQPGRYELVLKLPGFATVSNVLSLPAGANVDRRISLPIGSLEETITVVCSSSPAALTAGALRPLAFEGRGDGFRVLGLSAARVRTRADPPPPAAFAQERNAAGAIRVGGQIKAPRMLKKVNPVCPPSLVPAGGTMVRLIARVGVDGYMNEVRQIQTDTTSAPPPPEFVESALEAARQWVYTPTLLNGTPVEVNITIHILYRRT